MSDPSRFSLFKRANGYYYILFQDGGRKRWRSSRCRSKADALKALTQFEQLLLKRAVKTPSLSQFTGDFLEFAKVNYAKPTVVIFTIALSHLKMITGECSLSLLSARHVDLYKTKRITDGVSPVTVNVELRALRSILNTAVRWQDLSVNPFSKIHLLNIPERAPVFLAQKDFTKLISIVKEKWLKELIVVAALTGMRRGEILNLRWQSIDFSRKLIHIESYENFNTKRGKRRIIPMNETVFRILIEKGPGQDAGSYVFRYKGRRINGNHVTHGFKKYSRQINDNLHWHSLRHTFASWLVQNGVSLYDVQKLLGHSDIRVTEMYSHLAPEELHRSVNRISIEMN